MLSGRSGTVYSTGERPRRDVCLPRSRKDFLENHIIKKREDERRKFDFWNDVTKNNGRIFHQNRKFAELTSEEAHQASLASFKKARDVEARKAGLLGRRARLRALLDAEKEELEKELREMPDGVVRGERDFKSDLERLRKDKEEEQRKEAELKMLKHWKINNPQFRELESKKHEVLVRKTLRQQIEEKKNVEEERKEEEKQEEERKLEEDRRNKEEWERKEEEKRANVINWKKSLEVQINELRQKEREAECLARERAEQEELQRQMEECEGKRKTLEKLRQNRQIETFQKRQHRLKLRKKAKIIQEEIEEDHKILEEMLAITSTQENMEGEKRRKAAEELIWMSNVLTKQLEEEKKRENESEQLFAEEASQMFSKQEEVWKREEMARKRLMEDVVEGWRMKQNEMVEVAREREAEVMRKREEVKEDVQKLNAWIMEEEMEKRANQALFVDGLEEGVRAAEQRKREVRVQETCDEYTMRENEIRDENKLARCLAEWNLEEKNEKEAADFRRKKVRWYF